MSKTSICPNCNTENPLGSKYCNHCGTVIPPGTKIICRQCHTPNPRNRLYCDNCGAKLVKDKPPLPQTPPAEEQTTVKRFDLPSLPPGDTSDLDPSSVPDWLRTGEHKLEAATTTSDDDETLSSPAAESELDTSDLSTGDLPDWLIDGEEDVEDLFGAPPEITSEHYWGLVTENEAVEPEPEDVADKTADQRNTETVESVPPWSMTPNDTEDRSWLDDLGPVHTGLFSETQDKRPFDPTGELPDLPDWLADIGPAQTGALDSSKASVDDDDWDDQANLAEDFVEEPSTPFDLDNFAFTGPLQQEELEEAELPDWLASLRSEDPPAEYTSAEDTPDSPELEPETADFTDATDFDQDDPWAGQLFDEEPVEDVAEDLAADFTDEIADDLLPESDFLATAADETETTQVVDEETHDETLSDTFTTDPDWLLELDMAALADEEETADSEDLPDEPDASDTVAESAEPELAEEFDLFDDQMPPTADDLTFDEDPLAWAEQEESEQLPEWVAQLGPPGAELNDGLPDLEIDQLAQNEELPEWITDMMPADDQAGVSLSEMGLTASDDEYIDPLEGVPEELASAELPDWLHDAPAPRSAGITSGIAAAESSDDIPNWLQQTLVDEETVRLSAELSDLLGPPTLDTTPPLRQAEIPDWLQALKPAELTDAPLSDYVITSGPLSGMRGALEIEPFVAKPRTPGTTFPSFLVSTEQEEQVALLKQVVATETESQPVAGMRRIEGLSLLARVGLALLLVVAIIAGLWGPLLFTRTATVGPAVNALHTTIEAAANQDVLVVFDYTPALAAELAPQADLILQQLAQNNSRVVSLSQYTAGERLADLHTAVSHADNRLHFGYLPGEAIGVRQLGYCLAALAACDGLASRTLSADERQVLADASLVIILTGERNNLVNWIEQLTVYDDLTLAAAVTQGLRPVASPYVATGQLAGLTAGVGDAANYQQLLLNQPPDETLMRQQNAQGMAQILAAFLLLIGLVAYARRST